MTNRLAGVGTRFSGVGNVGTNDRGNPETQGVRKDI